MKSIKLVGVNVLDSEVKLSKDVHCFTDIKRRISVAKLDKETIQLTTAKGVYELYKHPSLNIYQGKCGNHKVHVTLRKIVGEVRFW